MSDVTIKRVSFFIWKDSRLTHVEESLRITDDSPKLMDKLKEKYGDSLSHIRKVWSY